MVASLFKNSAYVVSSMRGGASDVTGYAVTTSKSSAVDVTTYAVMAPSHPPVGNVTNDVSFVETRFPSEISFGSSGGPGFKTGIFSVSSGRTAVDIDWDRIRAKYSVSFDNKPLADMIAFEDFFYSMRGKGLGFRYKDWGDFSISNQNFFIGDGTSTSFQLFKRYESGGKVFDRIVKKPVASTVSIAVNGVTLVQNTDFFVNAATGVVTMAVPPAQAAVGLVVAAEYDVPVRFDSDSVDISYEDFRQLSSDIQLIEILV